MESLLHFEIVLEVIFKLDFRPTTTQAELLPFEILFWLISLTAEPSVKMEIPLLFVILFILMEESELFSAAIPCFPLEEIVIPVIDVSIAS